MKVLLLYSIFASLLLIVSFVFFRVLVRGDYKRKGHIYLERSTQYCRKEKIVNKLLGHSITLLEKSVGGL